MMKTAACTALLISSAVCASLKLISKRNSVDGCIDWSVDLKRYRSLVGEPVRVKCALFYSYIRISYDTAQRAKLRLIWYKNKGDSEEPIIFPGHRLSKGDDSIWFRSARLEDGGFYTCVLRNSTYCMKVSMSLTVEESSPGLCYSDKIRYLEKAQITKPKTITCPDINDYLALLERPETTWYKECEQRTWRSSIKLNTTSIWIPELEEEDGGNYTCEIKYGGVSLKRTVELVVTALLTTRPPKLLFPLEGPPTVVEAQLGLPTVLSCRVFFGYSGDSRPVIYWMKGEKFVEELEGHIKESEVRTLSEHLGEKEVELMLTFDSADDADMGDYTCYVENHIGRKSATVILQKKEARRGELAGGLGAVLLLLGLLTAVHEYFKLEILLCYRRRFGRRESDGDIKEYDAYLSHTKVDPESSEHGCRIEQFAQVVLPDVLEKHYGYKLFIPDRDLIPSRNYVRDLAHSLEQSRRLILTLTPSAVASRSWASLFQLEDRLHAMLVAGEIKVIMIECGDIRRVPNYREVEALKQTIKLLSVIRWDGPRSSQLRSRFWKRVLCEMPVKQKEASSRQQAALDSGEPGLFGDLQAISAIALTPQSVGFEQGNHTEGERCLPNLEYMEVPSNLLPVTDLSNARVCCHVPVMLLEGQAVGNNGPELCLNSTFVPLFTQGRTSDIW